MVLWDGGGSWCGVMGWWWRLVWCYEGGGGWCGVMRVVEVGVVL